MKPGRLQFLVLMCALACSNAGADEADDSYVRFAPTGGDTYVAGEDVYIRDAIQGDLVAAGSLVRVTGEVAEDVIAAAARIEIAATVGDDVRLAGADIELMAPVKGHAALAGNDIRVTVDAPIADWLWVTGSRLRLDGDIGGELRAAGADVELNSRVAGDVELVGGRLHLGDRAVVEGDLTWRSSEPIVISDKAVVRGQVIEAPLPEAFEEQEGLGLLPRLILALSLLLTAVVLRSLFPEAVTGWSVSVGERPFVCFFVGLAVLATTPLVIGLLFGTVVGWLLALSAVLVYGLLLAVAGIVGMNVLAALGLFWVRRGSSAAPSTSSVWIALAIVALLLALVGPLFLLFIVLGLGAMALRFYERWAQARDA